MYYQCCVCKTLRKDAISLHHFPGSEKRLNKWLNCLESHGFGKMSPAEISKAFICEKHFEERFITAETRRLKAKAYPSLFTPDEISSGIPSDDNTENVDPLLEHLYARKIHDDHTYCKLMPQKAAVIATAEPVPSTSCIEKPRILLEPNSSTAEQVTTCDTPDEQSQAQENVDPLEEHSYARKIHDDHTYCKMMPQKAAVIATAEPVPSTSCIEKPRILLEPNSSTAEQVTTCDTPDEQSQAQAVFAPIASTSDANISLRISPKAIATKMVATSNPLNEQSQDQGGVHDKLTKGPKTRRKRVIDKLMNLTPTGRKIYKEYKKSKRQADFYLRAKRASKFNKLMTFKKMSNGMNPYAKTILKMQINLCNKHKKGRRFTLEEKLIALSIMKQSPKCYRFLHKIFILPSRSTLNKMVAGLKIESGICPQVLEVIKRETEHWNEKKKMCSVIFDEISLETGVTYDKNKDKINGFVEKQNEYADHALVFMLRGAVYKWQQPIAFYFCQGATKSTELKNTLIEIVTAVVGCGLKPISLICDQGSAFQAALNSLKSDTAHHQKLANQEQDDTVTINGVNLMVIFDPPHLIKGLRNNFLNKDISVDGKISTWRDIVEVYETDCNDMETRMLHNLNDQCIIPEKIKKMKVKNCVKVFSYTMASALSFASNYSRHADGRTPSETLKNTSSTILFFDKLFDSVNGSATFSQKKGKDLRCAVSDKSPHHEFWAQSIEKLKKMKFIDRKGNPKSVPSLKNFISTIKTFMKLWQLFKSKNMRFLRPRFFNSDPIENFFGQVRAYNYRNTDPNCHSFMNTFKSLLITRIIKFHSDTYNCEDDSAKQIINLKALFDNDDDGNKAENVEPGHPQVGDVAGIVEEAQREQLNVLHSRAYTAGWVVTKTLQKFNNDCHRCKQCFTTQQGAIHKWINEKEYNAASKRLTYPSIGAVRCFGAIIKETNGFLDHSAHEMNLSSKILQNIMLKNSIGFFRCTDHPETMMYFMTVTIKFSITNWCNNINKILRGTDISRVIKRPPSSMEQKAFNKYKKRFKNKSFHH